MKTKHSSSSAKMITSILLGIFMTLPALAQNKKDPEYFIECKNLPFSHLTNLRIDQVGYGDYIGSFEATSDPKEKLNLFSVLSNAVNDIYSSNAGSKGMDLTASVSSLAQERNTNYYLHFNGMIPVVDVYFTNPGTFETSKVGDSVACEQSAPIGIDANLISK
jgi:hypothetical protein